MSESKVSEAPDAATHAFDEAVALESAAGCLRGQTHEAYWNMVSPFGGLTAAVALNGDPSSNSALSPATPTPSRRIHAVAG